MSHLRMSYVLTFSIGFTVGGLVNAVLGRLGIPWAVQPPLVFLTGVLIGLNIGAWWLHRTRTRAP